MLSKCASPSCSTPFRYLHEGKLYLIGRKPASGGRTPPADFKYSGNFRALEYVWLCSSCCCDLTIQVDDESWSEGGSQARSAERQHPSSAFNAVKTKRHVCQTRKQQSSREHRVTLVGSGLAWPNYECGARLSAGSQSLGQPGHAQQAIERLQRLRELDRRPFTHARGDDETPQQARSILPALP